MDKNLDISLAIDLLGGPVAAARLLGVGNYQTVQQWIKADSLPPKYCLTISQHSGVALSRLRPKDYWMYWGENHLLTPPNDSTVQAHA